MDHCQGKGHYDENGRVVRVVGNNIDITERKRLELALRESERRLREALKVGHMGYLDWNLVTNEIQWSPETYRLFGYVPGGGFSRRSRPPWAWCRPRTSPSFSNASTR